MKLSYLSFNSIVNKFILFLVIFIVVCLLKPILVLAANNQPVFSAINMTQNSSSLTASGTVSSLYGDIRTVDYQIDNTSGVWASSTLSGWQDTVSLDSSFAHGTGAGIGTNQMLEAAIIQTDGKIIIGGQMTKYNLISKKYLVRLNIDGSLDTDFNSDDIGVDSGEVSAMATTTDNKILIGGNFNSYNSIAMRGIARLNSDGTLDTSFTPGTTIESGKNISVIAAQTDGKIIIGGGFTTYNNISSPRLARLNVDGTLDTSFNVGTGLNSSPTAITIQADGKIIVGGFFVSYNGNIVNHIVRLNSDGSLDTSFICGTATDYSVYSVTLQSDGKIIIGGDFTTYNGSSSMRIARLKTDGTLDTSFTVGAGANNIINTIAIQSDGKMLIGGYFTSYNNISNVRIARLNSDGTLDTSFSTGGGPNELVDTVIIQPDGKIFVGGSFTTYDGIKIGNSLRLNADGSIDTSFNRLIGPDGLVFSSAEQPDGKIIIGGEFTRYNASTTNRIARLNADGSLDADFNSSGTGFSDRGVRKILVQPDGKIIVGGEFDSYNGTPASDIIRLNSDGSIDTSFVYGTGCDDPIWDIALQPDNKIIIVGDFMIYNGVARHGVARLNIDGTLDTSFDPLDGASNSIISNRTVFSVVIRPDGKMDLTGDFMTYNNITRNYVARINSDGSLDTTFDPGAGADTTVWPILLQTDGKIIVGGNFTTFGGYNRGHIVRLNLDGTVDSSFATGIGADGMIQNMILQSDGKILVTGDFTSYDGVMANRIARLDSNGNLDVSFNSDTGVDKFIYDIILRPDNKIIINGSFTSYSTTTVNYLTSLTQTDVANFSMTIPTTGLSVGTHTLYLTSRDGAGNHNTDYASTTFIISPPVLIFTNLNTVQDSNSIMATGTVISERSKINAVDYQLDSLSGAWASSTLSNLVQSGLPDVSFLRGNGLGLGPNGLISAVATTTGGKIVIGGNFDYYNGVASGYFVRINSDGTLDSTFNSGVGFNSLVNAIALQPDGKIIVGGAFTSYNASTTNCIVRLNADGSLDSDFSPTGTGLNSSVNAITLQPDGKIIVGGSFTSYNASTTNRLVRLNADGSLDSDFSPTGTGLNSSVNAITLQPDGKIIVGGSFTSYNASTTNRLVRLNADGTKDASFIIGTGANSTVYTIALQPDGKIVVGGAFTSYNASTTNYIARLNADGTKDASFIIGTGANSTVYTIALQPDGKIIVGGSFTRYNASTTNRIVRLNVDGSLGSDFNPTGTGLDNAVVKTITLQSDGKIIVGGSFTSYNTLITNYIARLNVDGSLGSDFNPTGTGLNNPVNVITLQSDGKIVVGGAFTRYNASTANRLVRLNADGSLNSDFSPTGTGLNNTVNAITLQPDGKIIVGGAFTSYNASTTNYIARLNANGSLDSDFNPTGTGLNNIVNAIALQPDGKIIVGGTFTRYNASTTNYIARLNADGSLDSDFSPTGTGLNNIVNAITLQPDGKIIVGGLFTRYNASTTNRIVRLNADGSLDSDFSPTGTGLNNTVNAITLQSDGKIIVGGLFTRYNASTTNRIVRLNVNGSLDSDFSPTGTGLNNAVKTITLQSDGKIVVGGAFTNYNASTTNHIVRLNADGTKDTGFVIGIGANSTVSTIALQSDDKIVVGGLFVSYNSELANYLVRLNVANSADFSVTVPINHLNYGTHTFYLQAGDLDGNQTSSSTIFVISSAVVPPAVVILPTVDFGSLNKGFSVLVITPTCELVVYSDIFNSACFGGYQYRNIISRYPKNCAMTMAQEQAARRTCVSAEGTVAASNINNSPSFLSFISQEKHLVIKINKSLSNRLSGRILLQVESYGQAWYISPINKLKYYLGAPSDVFSIMKTLALGVSNQTFNSFKNNTAPKRLSGFILIKPEDSGKAYYVNPLDLKLYYLGRPADALTLMRTIGLGISNHDLRQIGVGETE